MTYTPSRNATLPEDEPVASGRWGLSAAAAGAPAGVVSAFAEPSRLCVGTVLNVAWPPPCTVPGMPPSSSRYSICTQSHTPLCKPHVHLPCPLSAHDGLLQIPILPLLDSPSRSLPLQCPPAPATLGRHLWTMRMRAERHGAAVGALRPCRPPPYNPRRPLCAAFLATARPGLRWHLTTVGQP